MFRKEFIPGFAEAVAGSVVTLENPVRKPGLAEILPDVFSWVEFRTCRRRVEQRDVGGRFKFAGRMPAGFVEQKNGVGAVRDSPANFLQMLLHGVRVGAWRDESRSGVAGGADRTEEIGIGVGPILGLARTRAAFSPLVDETVLLSHPRLVLKPDFERCPGRDRFQSFRHPAVEVFLKASIA